MQTTNFEQGETLLIDKPLGWTSFDVVRKIRNTIKIKKVGHAGTLDPLATGLLLVCTGKNTKLIDSLQAQTKHYSGTFLLGETTPCYDREQEVDATYPINHITLELLEKVRITFLGQIWQTPPKHSAIKVNGKRAFDLARAGVEIELKPRLMEIEKFDLDTTNFPEISFNVVCTKGTYIRSLVHDFGAKCNSGAVLTSLKRTAIGDFDLKNAWQLQDFIEFCKQNLIDN